MRNTRMGDISTILFDAGNTLAFLHVGRVREALAEAGHPREEAALAAAEARARAVMYRRAGADPSLSDRGRWDVYVHELLAAAGVAEPAWAAAQRAVESAHRRHNLWRRVPEGTRETLDRLAARGFRLGVVSNADGRVRGLLGELGLADRFEVIVDSHEVGFEKPDPRIFEVARAHFGEPAARCAYVGDFPQVDVVGATRAGMAPVLLDPLGLGTHLACAVIPRLGDLCDLLVPPDGGSGVDRMLHSTPPDRPPDPRRPGRP